MRFKLMFPVFLFLLAAVWLKQTSSSHAAFQPMTKPRLGTGELTGFLDDGLDKAVSRDEKGRVKGVTVKIGQKYQCYFFVTPTTTFTGGELRKGMRVKVAYKKLHNSEQDVGYYFTGEAVRFDIAIGANGIPYGRPRLVAQAAFVESRSGNRSGEFILRVNGRARSFGWNSATKFTNESDPRAYEKGAPWEIVYTEPLNIGEDIYPFLWSITFTGHVVPSSTAESSNKQAKSFRLMAPASNGSWVEVGPNHRGLFLHWDSKKFPDGKIPYYINRKGSDDLTLPEIRAGIEQAFNAWKAAAKGAIDFRFAGYTSATGFKRDGQNVISWDETGELFAKTQSNTKNAFAATSPVNFDPLTGELLEADIVFNGSYVPASSFRQCCSSLGRNTPIQWNLQEQGCKEGLPPLKANTLLAHLVSQATHEIGHFIGIGHSDVAGATMFPGACEGTGQSVLKENDLDALRFLYPAQTSRQTGGLRQKLGQVIKDGLGITEMELRRQLFQQLIADGQINRQDCVEMGETNPVKLLSTEKVDLNGDGMTEIKVFGEQGCAFQGARRGMQWLYRKAGNRYELLGSISAAEKIDLLSTSTNGYRDLSVIYPAGNNYPEFREIFRFDGRRYQEPKQQRGKAFNEGVIGKGASGNVTAKPVQEDWTAFWSAFQIAVQKRDRKTLSLLMANPFEAVSAGLYTPAQWLKELDSSGGWRGIEISIKAGIKPNEQWKGRPSKNSKNNYLIFVLGKDGKWRWAAIGGD